MTERLSLHFTERKARGKRKQSEFMRRRCKQAEAPLPESQNVKIHVSCLFLHTGEVVMASESHLSKGACRGKAPWTNDIQLGRPRGKDPDHTL